MLIFMNHEAEGSGEEGFERGDIDFPVALAGVSVAHFEERAVGVDGNVERSAGHQLLIIHVAGMHPWRRAVDAACRGRGCIAHAAEKGVQWNLDTGSEVA